jgi:hypothetical protein
MPIGHLLVRKVHNKRKTTRRLIRLEPAEGLFPKESLSALPDKLEPKGNLLEALMAKRLTPRMALENTKTPVGCPRCGGSWFSEQEFRRYTENTYSQRVGSSARG